MPITGQLASAVVGARELKRTAEDDALWVCVTFVVCFTAAVLVHLVPW